MFSLLANNSGFLCTFADKARRHALEHDVQVIGRLC